MRTMSSKSSHLRGPSGFSTARRKEESCIIVENRPYVPSLFVNLQAATVVNAARVILSNNNNDIKTDTEVPLTDGNFDAKVSRMSGGLTNALFMVHINKTTVLVRIFGAEGMIDRDIETANFARLCHAKNSVVHRDLDYLGRFGNGRVETLISNMRAATVCDLRTDGERLALEVTRQMARLHHQFDIPEYLLEGDSSSQHEGGMDHCRKPVMWDVLSSWKDELVSSITQACSTDYRLVDIFVLALFGYTLRLDSIISECDIDGDKNNESRLTIVMSHIEQQLTKEIRWIQDYILTQHPDAPLAFCHNDINAANILYSENSKCYDEDSVALIDYEYGAINYAMYDLANFICEHCGGNDNGIPDYNLIPSLEMQRKFVKEYILEKDRILQTTTTTTTTTPDEQEESPSRFLSEVQTFQLLSHLYWGYWGILQGAKELSSETYYEVENIKLKLLGEVEHNKWDNLRYGKNRLARYRKQKQSMLVMNEM